MVCVRCSEDYWWAASTASSCSTRRTSTTSPATPPWTRPPSRWQPDLQAMFDDVVCCTIFGEGTYSWVANWKLVQLQIHLYHYSICLTLNWDACQQKNWQMDGFNNLYSKPNRLLRPVFCPNFRWSQFVFSEYCQLYNIALTCLVKIVQILFNKYSAILFRNNPVQIL